MAIFNMAIQVFVVMSSYQSIAQKFKKTGNPKVSFYKGVFILTTEEDVICGAQAMGTLLHKYAPLFKLSTLASTSGRNEKNSFYMIMYPLRGGQWSY